MLVKKNGHLNLKSTNKCFKLILISYFAIRD